MSVATAEEPSWLDRAQYPFTNRWVDLSPGRVHYIDEGTGDPILFVHGTPTWSFEYRHVVRALAATHRCIAPDHLGFGLSERPAAFSYSIEAHRETLMELVARLALRDLTLVVHDFGGPIALPLALTRPGVVRRVVIMNTWMWPLDDDPVIRRGGRLAGSWVGKLLYRELDLPLKHLMPTAFADRSKLVPEVHAQYLAPFSSRSSRSKVLWPLARELLGAHAYYAALERQTTTLASIPATIVWGMKDPAIGTHHLEHWERLLPHAWTTRIAEAGHWPHEEAPEQVVAAIRELVERTRSRTT